MQLWNIYRSRAIGYWLQLNGITVIPNIRFGDHRTFRFCCDGIEERGVIAVGSYGVLRDKKDRAEFLDGLDYVVKRLKPTVIVVYGSAPEKCFKKYSDAGIRIVHFESDYAVSHKEAT